MAIKHQKQNEIGRQLGDAWKDEKPTTYCRRQATITNGQKPHMYPSPRL